MKTATLCPCFGLEADLFDVNTWKKPPPFGLF